MIRPAAALAALVLGATAAPTAEPAPARFRVAPAGRGPQRLDTPAALASASAGGDLADLRLRDAAGREVPYLLVAPPDAAARWAASERIRPIPPTKTESGAEIDLATVRTVEALEVGFARGGFLKRARLEGSADGSRWTRLVEDDVLYDLPVDPAACGGEPCSGPLARRELRFAPAPVRWLRLVLDDRRSPRLGTPETARARLAPATAAAPGLSVPLAVERREGEPGTSRFALRLPGPRLPVRAVVLDVDAPRLARRARVLEARLAGGRLSPVELGAGPLLRVEQDGVVVSALRVPVSAPEETELELVVEDGDNAPLALRGAAAELAPLPWIFFESADGAPLHAALGDPALRAPRYDLEALRPELPKLRTAVATATAEPGTAPLAAPAATPDLAGAAGAGAPIDAAGFRHARAVPAAAPGLAAVRLDAAVLAGSGDLGDVRLRGPDGRQLPYLLEERDEPLAVPLAPTTLPREAAPRRLAAAGVTVRRVPLPDRGYPESRLVLATDARVFTREVLVYEQPREGAGEPRLLARASWAHADPARPAPSLTVPLPALRGAALLVTLDDGDNAPLAVSSAKLLLRSYRLRFFHPGPALELLYGSEAVGAPRYDLALLAPRLRAAPAQEVPLAAAPPAGQETDASTSRARAVFWAVLGATVVGLLALVGRLLTRHGKPAAQ